METRRYHDIHSAKRASDRTLAELISCLPPANPEVSTRPIGLSTLGNNKVGVASLSASEYHHPSLKKSPSFPDLNERLLSPSIRSPTDSVNSSYRHNTQSATVTPTTPSLDDAVESCLDFYENDCMSVFSFDADREEVLDVRLSVEPPGVLHDEKPVIPIRTESLNTIREPISLRASKKLRRLHLELTVQSQLEVGIPPYQPQLQESFALPELLVNESEEDDDEDDVPLASILQWRRPSPENNMIAEEAATIRPKPIPLGGLSTTPIDIECFGEFPCHDNDREAEEIELIQRISDISNRPLIQIITIINMMTPLLEKYPDLVTDFAVDTCEPVDLN
ncbi:hypothetical protein BDR26DRAFT_848744 [Obelidium mucronatum]|nr:hypothetical protein BDR26DRAFT_848744 [Obelidium mucronatum]